MRDPSGRLLQLLSLLQTPRDWTGAELAARLGVTGRTIRRDIERLRELGYPVDATQGNVGGYRLAAGTTMPPLLLDDDEAIAIAVGLRTAATSASLSGIGDTALRALAKLEQVLPSRLRHRVTSLSQASVVLPPRDGPSVDPEILAGLAAACVAHEKVRFLYTRPDGVVSRRLVEPHRLVAHGRLWYLVAYDEGRTAWRSFRADRMAELHRTGVRVAPRELPGGVDTETWAQSGMPTMRARVLLRVPLAEAVARIPEWQGSLEAVDDTSCVLETHPDSLEYLAFRLVLLPFDFTLLEPPELARHLSGLAGRIGRAVDVSG